MKTNSLQSIHVTARRGAVKSGRTWLLAAAIVASRAIAPAQDNSPAPQSGQVVAQADSAPAQSEAAPTGMAAALARLRAERQAGLANTNDTSVAPGTSDTVATPAGTPGDTTSSADTQTLATTGTAGTNGLTLNFRNAPIDLVLSYLSDAAGFIIEVDTRVSGSVTVMGKNLTKDDAVQLLDSVLGRNGYTAIRTGERGLKILDKRTAQSANNRVVVGGDPGLVPDNDEMVTQIIPIRFVEAQQLVSDLSPFVSSDARIIANQAGNSIVITDTQSNIKHLMEIIKDIDSSAEDVTEIRYFHLDHADPTETANLLTSLFPDTSNGGATAPIRFGGGRGGFGGFGRGGFGGPGGFFGAAFGGANNTGNPQADRIKHRQQVVAVPDPRTSSVAVTATKDLMDQIEVLIHDLDVSASKDQNVAVFHLDHADGQEILPVLQQMFQSSTANRYGNQNNQQNSLLQMRLSGFQQSMQSSSAQSSTLLNTVGGGGRGGAGGF